MPYIVENLKYERFIIIQPFNKYVIILNSNPPMFIFKLDNIKNKLTLNTECILFIGYIIPIFYFDNPDKSEINDRNNV